MNPRTKFFRGLALIGALGVGLAACEDTIVNVETPPAISASPSTMSLTVGQSQAIVASLTGLTGGVTYTSTAATVATVDANGLVTAVAPGSATIQVASQTDPNIKTGVGVVVTAATLPPSGDAEVAIQQITVGSTTIPANPENISGRIDVMMSVSRGDADRLVVLLNGEEVGSCSQSFGNAAAAAELTAANLQLAPNQRSVVCSINTAAFNAQTGEVTFLNDSYDLVVELRKGTEVLDRARIDNLQFNNVDTVIPQVSVSGPTAADVNGVTWNRGSLTVTGVPVMYSGNTVTAVEIAVDTGIGTLRQVLNTAPFSITFSDSEDVADGGVADVEDRVEIEVDGFAAAGSVAPAGTVTTLLLDNVAPNGGDFELAEQNLTPTATVPVELCCSNNWVGANYNFASGKDGEADFGVGIGSVTFHVGAAAAEDTTIAKQPAVTRGGDLTETQVNTTLRAVAVVTDRLGNQTIVPLATNARNPRDNAFGATLGVDLTAPTATFATASVGQQAIFNITDPAAGAAAFTVGISDGGTGPSGFVTNPVLTVLDRWAPELDAADRCEIGVLNAAGTVCQAEGTSGSSSVVNLDPGYYTYTARAVDQAGNESSVVTRVILVDEDDAPTGGNITVPSTLVGGRNATFSVDVEDDVNLHLGNLWVEFDNGEEIPFSQPALLNAQFPTSLLAEATLSRTIPFVRALQLTGAGDAPNAAAIEETTGVLFRAFDAAFNEDEVAFASLNPVGTPVDFADAAIGVQAFRISTPAAAQQICATTCTGPTVPNTRTLTAIATGNSGTFANPFSTVNFYRVDADGIVRLIATAGAPVLTDAGVRTYTWTADFNATGLPAQANVEVFAVGVNASGDALRAADNTNLTIIAP